MTTDLHILDRIKGWVHWQKLRTDKLYDDDAKIMTIDLDAICESIQIALEALEFYEDDFNYLDCDPNDKWPENASYEFSQIRNDDGDRAKKALEAIKEKLK